MRQDLRPEEWCRGQVIALGYYDGPNEGVVKLENGEIFRFATVAEDLPPAVRVFTVSRLTQSQFDEVMTVISKALGAPRWPTWVPLWTFADADTQPLIEERVDAILNESEMTAAVLCSDDLQRCMAVKSVDIGTGPEDRSWFEFMSGQD